MTPWIAWTAARTRAHRHGHLGVRATPLFLSLALLPGCAQHLVASADDWPEADALFTRDTRWVGGDGAISIPLGGDRVLWSFGDSFISRGELREREGAAFARNSVAVQTGLDPTSAIIGFTWGADDQGGPTSFAQPDEQAAPGDWLWPGQGARVGQGLLLFYGVLHAENAGLGYASDTWTAFWVDDPDDDPGTWRLEELPVPDTHGIDVGAATFFDGDDVVVAGQRGDDHDTYLLRWSRDAVARRDLSAPRFFCGAAGWGTSCEPAVVIAGAAPELSIHLDPITRRWLEVETTGFGATQLTLRWADLPEGPWSEPEPFYTPDESFGPCAFVYAGKAHPELTGADLLVTYVASHFPECNIDDPALYVPRFVRVTLERP